MRLKIKHTYPKGIEVVKNTDANYDIYSRMGDYTSPNFYAATNPNQYDLTGLDSISNPLSTTQDNSDDTYQA